MTTLNGIARGPRKLAISLACATVLGLTATPTVAKTIHMTAPTRARLSVTKAADGTIAAEASYTSPNNRCLVAKRWKKKSDGVFHDGFDGVLVYGEPIQGGNYGSGGIAAPPHGGWLAPVSRPGRSPYSWRAVWPADTTVQVENVHAQDEAGRRYKSTVGAAPHITLYSLAPKFETEYQEGGERVALTCGAALGLRIFSFWLADR